MEEEPNKQKVPRFFMMDLGKKCFVDKEIKIYPDHSPAAILTNYLRACGFTHRFRYTDTDALIGGYAATVFIEDFEYLTGYGTNKVAAKQHASKRCMKVILPEIQEFWPDDDDELRLGHKYAHVEDLDPISLSIKLNEKFPYACLKTCLRQNYGQNGLDINDLETSYTSDEDGNHCKLIIQNYAAVGTSDTKRNAREFAALKLLMQMHPLVSAFSGILQIYGKRSANALFWQRTQEERQKVLDLQIMDRTPAPVNFALLAHLREEMLKLKPVCFMENERSA